MGHNGASEDHRSRRGPMARSDYPLSTVLATVRSGISARAGLRAYRAGGNSITDSVWFRMVSETRRSVADRIQETSRPITRRPSGDEITRLTSRKQAGYWQEVEIFYLDKSTGEVGSSPFVLRGKGLLTRRAVMDFALAEWEAGSSGSPNPDDHEVLGAAYVSTLELFPEG